MFDFFPSFFGPLGAQSSNGRVLYFASMCLLGLALAHIDVERSYPIMSYCYTSSLSIALQERSLSETERDRFEGIDLNVDQFTHSTTTAVLRLVFNRNNQRSPYTISRQGYEGWGTSADLQGDLHVGISLWPQVSKSA
jgi:hypothetical protein